jgi:hypothetical protein
VGGGGQSRGAGGAVARACSCIREKTKRTRLNTHTLDRFFSRVSEGGTKSSRSASSELDRASPPRGDTPDARVGVTSRLVLRRARRSRLTGARVAAGVPRDGRRTSRGRAESGGTTPPQFPGAKSGALVTASGGCRRVQRRSAASSRGAPARHERARSRASARAACEGPATSRASTGAIPVGRGTRDPKRPTVGATSHSGIGVHVVRCCPGGPSARGGGGAAAKKQVHERRGRPPGGEHSPGGSPVPRRSVPRRRR